MGVVFGVGFVIVVVVSLLNLQKKKTLDVPSAFSNRHQTQVQLH